MVTDFNIVEKKLAEAVHLLLPKLPDKQSGLIYIVGKDEYAVMVYGQESVNYDVINTMSYPKIRFLFIQESLQDKQLLGFVPACEVVEQELAMLNLKPLLHIEAPFDPAITTVKSITLYSA